MLRRLPWRKRSANRLGGLLPVVIPVVTFFFPLSGYGAAPEDVSGSYWSRDAVPGSPVAFEMLVSVASAGVTSPDMSLTLSVRCVRAREGQAIPCFFPLSGYGGGEEDVSGSYWSRDALPADRGPVSAELLVHAASAVATRADPLLGLSVRCVRAREEQAVPLFWFTIYDVLCFMRDWPESGASD